MVASSTTSSFISVLLLTSRRSNTQPNPFLGHKRTSGDMEVLNAISECVSSEPQVPKRKGHITACLKDNVLAGCTLGDDDKKDNAFVGRQLTKLVDQKQLCSVGKGDGKCWILPKHEDAGKRYLEDEEAKKKRQRPSSKAKGAVESQKRACDDDATNAEKKAKKAKSDNAGQRWYLQHQIQYPQHQHTLQYQQHTDQHHHQRQLHRHPHPHLPHHPHQQLQLRRQHLAEHVKM